MRIIIAPDSYKGSLTAVEAASAMKAGALRVFPEAFVDMAPIADGGEGTVESLVAATSGSLRSATVSGPLGKPVRATWGMAGDGKTAVIEMAAASGLPLLDEAERDPLTATTYGTGELVRAALDAGAQSIILGIGGSATNDGGAGFASALGARFLDIDGRELPPGGAALARLASIDLSGLDARLATTPIRVACDVDNPLCGPRGASAVFGPQKGASPEQVRQLDAALATFASVAAKSTGRSDVATTSGTGAAGGLGAGLLFFTRATLSPGVELVLDAIGFAARVQNASLVITGEGRTDFQTAYGKAPVGVALAAKRHGPASGICVVCVSGGLGDGAGDVYAHGIDAMTSIAPGPISLETCLANGADLVTNATERICRALKAGRLLGAYHA